MRRLIQGNPQRLIAFACLARAAFTGAFMVARRDACLRRQVIRRRKATHVRADLCHHDFSRLVGHAGNGIQ
jgi:hypothetical protein